MVSKWLKRFYITLIFTFLYAPILVLAVFSFNDSSSTAKWEGFTLRWYRELATDSMIVSSMYYTILIAICSAIIATLIGTFAAYGIFHMKRWPKKVLLNINAIPMLNPDIVTGVSLMTLFIALNVRFGFSTLLIAHITFNVPYVIMSILPKLTQMPEEMVEAAMDLGATPWQAFTKVVIPEIKPGIITGALIAFTLSIDDFVISFFTTGPGVSNLSIEIYSRARRGVSPEINALSTIMFLVVLILIVVINKRTKMEEL